MPPGKKQQSNATLIALITFVGLFIISVVLAVIFYVKFEDQKTIASDSQNQLNELADSREWNARGKIVGAKGRGSYLGKMVEHLDRAVFLIAGGPLAETSAEAKVESANLKVTETMEILEQGYIGAGAFDPNTNGLIRVIEILKANLDNIMNAGIALQEQFEQLQGRFDDAMTASFEKEQALLAEKESYHQQVIDIEKSYNELKALMEQTTDQQVQGLLAQVDSEKVNSKQLRDNLLKTQAELKMAEDMMKRALEELRGIKPLPDSKVAAFKPDGEIMLIDNQAKIVHINIGSDQGVYQGLTFSVYNKNVPIPKDGESKAEIEIYKVEKNISAARVIRSNIRKPIVKGDPIANLIWDSAKTNVFVVAGDFDLDSNGTIDYGAIDKLKALIERQNGRADDKVTINTDFVVLGKTPRILRKPSFEELEVYPLAMERYEASVQKFSEYNEIQTRAEALLIPIFNYERFLYFIGYSEQASKPGAF